MSTNKTYDLTNNYINIQGWMVERLNLKGNELLLYALIFGFCQDGNSRFTGSLKYMCHWTGLSEQGVRNTLKSLVEKNLLNRYEIYKQNVMFVEYVVTNLTPPQKIIPPLKNDIETPSKNLGGEVKKFGGGGQKIWGNNTIDNIEYNNIDTKEKNIKKENIVCEDLSFQSLVDSVKELEPTLFAKTRNIERKIKEIDDELSKIGMPLPTYINKPLLVACFVFARTKRITINSFLQDIKSLQDLYDNGADIEKCLQEWLVRSWTAVRYEYFSDNRGRIKPSFLVSSVLYDGRGASYGQVAKDWSGTTKTQAIDPNQAFKDLCTFGSESK